MIKLLFTILVTFSTSINILLCEDLCSNYNDQNCIHPNAIKNGHFINQWSVYLPGTTKEQARLMLEANGFDYLGQVMDGVDLHLVTKKGTPEKHAMPNEQILELLKKQEQVHSVAQTHVLDDSNDDTSFNIIEGNDVKFISIDPDTIKLNDGSENLKRIQDSEMNEWKSTMSRQASNNHESDTVNTDQMNDYYNKNVDGKETQKQHHDEEVENKSEESNDVESSDDED